MPSRVSNTVPNPGPKAAKFKDTNANAHNPTTATAPQTLSSQSPEALTLYRVLRNSPDAREEGTGRPQFPEANDAIRTAWDAVPNRSLSADRPWAEAYSNTFPTPLPHEVKQEAGVQPRNGVYETLDGGQTQKAAVLGGWQTNGVWGIPQGSGHSSDERESLCNATALDEEEDWSFKAPAPHRPPRPPTAEVDLDCITPSSTDARSPPQDAEELDESDLQEIDNFAQDITYVIRHDSSNVDAITDELVERGISTPVSAGPAAEICRAVHERLRDTNVVEAEMFREGLVLSVMCTFGALWNAEQRVSAAFPDKSYATDLIFRVLVGTNASRLIGALYKVRLLPATVLANALSLLVPTGYDGIGDANASARVAGVYNLLDSAGGAVWVPGRGLTAVFMAKLRERLEGLKQGALRKAAGRLFVVESCRFLGTWLAHLELQRVAKSVSLETGFTGTTHWSKTPLIEDEDDSFFDVSEVLPEDEADESDEAESFHSCYENLESLL